MLSKERFDALESEAKLSALLHGSVDDEAIFGPAVNEMERIAKLFEKDAYKPLTPEKRREALASWKKALVGSLRDHDD